ncbi:MAG: YegS/Rv2252/BmrU family lipid kinase [Melioribacteraceae bacterium]|nr:YegS/Rv2252/BmrU family lipid kinase [Melioribacteraceae bacterium]
MNKYTFIINPKAGSGLYKKHLESLKKIFTSYSIELEIIFTEYRGHAQNLALEHSRLGNNILVGGGDGTLHEVVNGVELSSNIKIGLLPLGTGNDFVYALGGDRKFETAIQNIVSDKLIQTDAGEIEFINFGDETVYKKRFANSCGLGFDAFVSHLNNNKKLFSGLFSYIISVFEGVFKYNYIQSSGKIDDQLISQSERLLIAIGNGKTAGGGFYLTPNGLINDGLFDVTFINSIKKWKIFLKLPLVLLNKTEKIHEASLDRFSKLELNLERPTFIHCDGEVLSTNCKQVIIRQLSKKLTFHGAL